MILKLNSEWFLNLNKLDLGSELLLKLKRRYNSFYERWERNEYFNQYVYLSKEMMQQKFIEEIAGKRYCNVLVALFSATSNEQIDNIV